MKQDASAGSSLERVKQIHYAYLDAVYEEEYYKCIYGRTVRYAKHFDFAIAVGAASSGGSGLGILADPRLAWICALLTTASVVLSIAKTSYGWSGRLESALSNINFFGKLSRQYRDVIDDMNHKKHWNNDFDHRYLTLRQQRENAPTPILPELSIEKRREIQNQIKAKVPFQTWWVPAS